MPDLALARSFLFVPGDRPERFTKAVSSGAHTIIIDLEDAVAPEDKPEARNNILSYLDSTSAQNVLVRINDAESAFYEEDLAVAAHPQLSGVVLPKANKRHTTKLVDKLEHPVWPLVETVAGISEVNEFAKLPNLARLLLGTIDLSLEMGLDMSHPAGRAMMDQARFGLVSASFLANLASPIDGVFPALDDEIGLKRAAKYARSAGMGGMMCIHPSQIDPLHDSFAQNEIELEWAGAVIAAAKAEKSSFCFRGQMVDKPILDRARKILALSETE